MTRTTRIAYKPGERRKHACDDRKHAGDQPGRLGDDVIRLDIERERLGDVRYCSAGNT
jgi:hypothetical protein